MRFLLGRELSTDLSATRDNVVSLTTAEGVGFEPTVPCDTTVFETVRLVHSRIPPTGLSCSGALLASVPRPRPAAREARGNTKLQWYR